MKTMERALVSVCLSVVVLGCGAAGAAGGGGGGAGAGRPSAEDREAQARQIDKGDGQANRDTMKRQLDSYLADYDRQKQDLESKMLDAAAIALGEKDANGQREKGGVGSKITKLKSAGVNPKLTANPDFQSGFLMADGTSYGKDLAKVPANKQDVARTSYTDFAYQVSQITWASYQSSQFQLILQLQAVSVAASIVRNQKKFGLTTNDDDVALMKRSLDFARRGDEMAAAGAGMSAALMAVTNGGKAPKVLDDMSNAVKKSLPSKAEATNDEAKAYLAGFEGGLGDARARYEGMLKASYGNDWERSTMKSIIDQIFKQAEEATNQKSNADKRAADNARPNTIIPGGGKAGAGGAGAAGGGGGLLPSDGPIAGALAVVDALKKGDPKGAVKGALAFVPPGPIKAGLGAVLSLL